VTVRPILRWPHAVLRKPATPVAAVTPEIRAIWADMVDTMEAMPGLGLAAPQIGVGLRLAVVDASAQRGQAVLLANPEITAASDTTIAWEEASPCLPGVQARTDRPERVTVRFLNAEGAVEERAFAGGWAVSVQHQIDHLDGRMFFDRLSPLRRRMLLAKAAKGRR
jgi:peptide deformylase